MGWKQPDKRYRIEKIGELELDLQQGRALAAISDEREALEAGMLGFTARSMAQATMPHSKPKENEFIRRAGNITLMMQGSMTSGLPYGSYPRLLLAWLTTEAIQKQSREIEMGASLSDFMRRLEIVPTGGRWGSITRLKDQVQRLFGARIIISRDDQNVFAMESYEIASKAELWWMPNNQLATLDQYTLFESYVLLGENFYNEIIENPVPVDIRALYALKKSPMALDIYTWLTYRVSYLRRPVMIPIEGLMGQFGASYPVGTARGRADFKKKFNVALKAVLGVYDVNVQWHGQQLLIKPSPTHVPR